MYLAHKGKNRVPGKTGIHAKEEVRRLDQTAQHIASWFYSSLLIYEWEMWHECGGKAYEISVCSP